MQPETRYAKSGDLNMIATITPEARVSQERWNSGHSKGAAFCGERFKALTHRRVTKTAAR